MRIAAYVAYAIVSIPGVVAGGRKGVVAIEGVFSHPCIAYMYDGRVSLEWLGWQW